MTMPISTRRFVDLRGDNGTVDVREINRAIRAWEASPENLREPIAIIDTNGGDDLGGGVQTGWAIVINNFTLVFHGIGAIVGGSITIQNSELGIFVLPEDGEEWSTSTE